MASISQAGMPLRLKTPLPTDTLVLERLTGSEKVSDPFELQLDMISENASVNPKDLLFKPVCVTVDLPSGGQRYFHGVVRRFVQLGKAASLVSYRAEVVPKVWFQSLTSDCRIFQDKTVPDIIKKVLDDAGVTYDMRVSGNHPVREYCVQYRETGLAFVSRLMEDEGIFYFFRHEADQHTMVMTDMVSEVRAGPLPRLSLTSTETDKEVLTSLEVRSEVVSSKYTLIDYNDKLARSLDNFEANENGDPLHRFDYPGGFATVEQGRRLAKVRLEEVACRGFVVSGHTNYRGLASGQKLDVANHYRRDVNQSYQVLSAQHQASEQSYRSKSNSSAGFSFDTSFEAIPYSVPFRPARVTPPSIVQGTQTAVVVGPAGEELFVDKYGRVKVQFFWDRVGTKNEKSSCWVRVSSAWAGKQWGAIHVPRIGQEVVVDFLEGNPDRPIIVGRVYNNDQMPPYELPANGTQSGVKTRSSPNGGGANANELRFEDKKSQEQILLHAEKDFMLEVEKDETHTVGQDRRLTVDRDETTRIKGIRSETVEKDQRTNVTGGNVNLKAGAGGITYEAMQSIVLKVGQNSITIDQGGVTIKGMNIVIDGQVQTEVKGLMTKVNATAMLTVKGAITMIN